MKIVQIGVGPLGQKVVRFALERGGIEIVAAVDNDSKKVGRDLGEVCSLKPLGITVGEDLKSALKRKKADVAVLTTVSSLKAQEKQIREAAQAKMSIVSSCEELSFPWQTQPRIAKRIDNFCKRMSVACVGTGVNPGFLMDYLPSVLTSVCQKITKIKITRAQDASKRRIPFQQKMGAGLTRAQFKARLPEGTLRHVGLVESLHMIAHSMNWELDRTTESLKPVVARETITSGYVKIDPGIVCGVDQIARGYMGKKEVVRLEFRAAVGEEESFDSIEINGTPSIKSTIPWGINGDIATCAIIINAIRSITRVEPGLKTMLDLPVPTYFHGS
jgi:4-hydroxy-tetrahydrodipicolinate reductase